jgi:phosphoribosylformylglycinamidine cyclo-ligase
MSDLISGKGFGFDLAGMVVGMLSKKEMVLGDKIKPNDVIIGIQSSGLHSNGYSLARKALLSKYSVKDNIKGVGNLGNALLRPTEIYVKPVLEALKKCKINGLAHITGGAFTKLLRLKQIGYHLDNMPKTPALMQLIEDTGVKNEEMYKTFNMGIGFCIITPEKQVKKIHKIFNKHKMKSYEIGRISKNKGVFINKLKIA